MSTALGGGGLVVSSEGGPPGPIGPIGPPGPAATFKNDIFTPALNQVIFVLSGLPIDIPSVIFSVNGVIYQQPSDYTIILNTLTWTNALFNLSPTDTVQVYYET